jgi:thiamine biosynthesis lipoprotein
VPDASQIAQARTAIGYRRLAFRTAPAALRKEVPHLTIDLNAVAPGYAVDLIVERFAAMGVANFMIDIGGEVRAHGRNAQGEAWRIAVEKPIDDEPEPYAIVKLDDIAVTTSGEYRHYVMRDGHRYSHTIDPRTGHPVEHRLASVVVVMPTAVEADAWATALNVLGEEEGYKLAQQQQIPAMFIVAASQGFEHRMSAGFERFLAVAPQ